MLAKAESYRQQLQRLGRNLGVNRFWSWWVEELVATLPSGLRQQPGSFGRTCLVEISGTELTVKQNQDGRYVETGRMNCTMPDDTAQRQAFHALLDADRRGGRTVTFGLTPHQVLLKEVELPLAAEENLHQVLAFEMDRLTPFKSSDVYFDFRIIERDSARNRMRLQLATATRSHVDSGMALLKQLGIQPEGAVLAQDMAGSRQVFDFIGQGQRIRPENRFCGVNRALGGVMVVLALVVLAMPLVLKRQAVRELNPLVERARLAAEATDKLRAGLEQKVAEHNFLLEKRQYQPPVIILLDELTRLLPDDTWAQQFDVKGGELQIQGETGSSSKLIVLLEQSKILSEANFRSPLTKGAGNNTERFHLAAKIQPMPAQPLPVVSPPAPKPPVPTPEKQTPVPASGEANTSTAPALPAETGKASADTPPPPLPKAADTPPQKTEAKP